MTTPLLAALLLANPALPNPQTTQGQPFPLTGRPATVVVFLSHQCPIANDLQPTIRRLQQKHHEKGVRFLGVHIDPTLTPDQAEKHRKDFQLNYPVTIDTRHTLVKALQATITPQAVLLDQKGRIRYSGRIDDTYADIGARRPRPTTADLDQAIRAVLTGKQPDPAQTKPVGCVIPPLSSFKPQIQNSQ